MSQTHDRSELELSDRLDRFLRNYCKEAIGELAQHYPNEQRSLEVDWLDLHQGVPDFADDYLVQPEWGDRELREALRLFDLSIDITLANAHVRVCNLPETHTFYPGGFSPSDHQGTYRAIRGEVTKTSDVYPKVEEAAFECQLCATVTRVPQVDNHFQEPHECKGCERQGPFRVDFDESEFVDAQKLRVKVPPELADGAGQKIDAFVEDDIAGEVTIGDRVKVSGIVQFEQETKGSTKKPTFEEYLEGRHIEIEQTDQQDLDVSTEERKQIEALVAGEEGDPLELAAESLSEKVRGYGTQKKALILSMASGAPIEYGSGDTDRSNLHVLLIGDPSTGKSKLIRRAADVGWRTVSVTSRRATGPGLTVTAEQDDFGDGEWSLKAGAFVKANGGTVCIDELDDMAPDTRSHLLEPMANQEINATIAGEHATFRTEAGVIAAANPTDGRFDKYSPTFDQIDFRSDLISRFDLIFTIHDRPAEKADRELAGHILDSRDQAKRRTLEGDDTIDVPVGPDLLRKWIALAKQTPNPPFKSEDVKAHLREGWLEIRGLYDYDDDQPIPVTVRDLEGIIRIAEAAAKFELADEIEMRHARIATELMGESMRDIGQNEDGEFDADVKETGTSKSQKDRLRTLVQAMVDMQVENDGGMVGDEELVDHLIDEYGFERRTLYNDLEKMKEQGAVTVPQNGYLRYIGGS